MSGPLRGEKATDAWKSLVHTASDALAQSDVKRLEKLADSCQTLENSPILLQDSDEFLKEMAMFRRVLAVTRANLHVMHRLQATRAQHEYRGQSACGYGIEGENGNH